MLALFAGSICASRWHYWKEKAREANAAYDDLMNRALRAEKDEAGAKDELARWQSMLAAMQSRPIIATLNDQQAAALITAVQSFVAGNIHGPN